ncbi:MAG: C4-dicarboxylate ABC transporter substrate-binding protein [Desulfobacterales bacterium]|nr:MAG: C4-dicarboxylate ABC transporter substrate-binding protein [Desulfobacterales bacterium]
MQKRVNRYGGVFSVLCVSVVFSFANAAFSADKIVLKFAGQSAADHPATDFMKAVAKEIQEKTDGRVEVNVYPASQLGDYTLVYEEQIRGTIDMSCISVPSQFDPRLELVYINGYVGDYETLKKNFSKGAWMFNKLDELNSRLGVKLLGLFVEGMIGIGSTKPANEPLNPNVPKDVLVRIPNMDVYKLGGEAMGFRTVTVPYADVYQSIQTGVVDGVDGYPTAAAYTILGDVLKYWYATNYSVEVLNCLISAKTWAKLSPKDQKIIQEIFDRGTAKSIDNARKVDEHYMELMRKKGIKVYTYNKKELEPLMKACADSWSKLDRNMTKELMDEFKKELAPK